MTTRDSGGIDPAAVPDWETMFDTCPEYLLILSGEGVIVRQNALARSFFGSDSIGKAWHSFLAESPKEEERDAFDDVLPPVFSPDGNAVVEAWFRREDGEVCFVSWFCRAMPDGSGSAFLASGRDLTDRHVAELGLREKQALLTGVLDNTLDGIVTIDTSGIIIAFNHSAERLFDYRAAEVLGRNVSMLMPQPHRDAHDNYIATFLQTGKANIIGKGREVLGLKSCGNTFPFFLTISQPIRIGQHQFFIGLIRDLSREKQVEAQLRQSQKMESIGTLAGGIAHDFNNILGGLMGYAELMMEDAEEGSYLHDDLGEMLQGCLRAKALVQQILTFSRQDQPQRQPCSLQPIIKEALKLLRATIPTTVELRRQIDGDCGTVMADITQIHQLMMNLCTNAFHAIGNGGGVIEVELAPFFLDANYHGPPLQIPFGNYVRLTVADNGSGMDEETKERIFEPFFTTKPMGRGTGMGLAVVHGIVRGHGGDIVVESKLGQGSAFHVYLPELEEPAEEESASREPASHGKGRIMLVDDDVFLLRIQERILRKQGYSVRGFKDPREALSAFQANPNAFDMVLTDQTMPQLTGVDLAQKIAAIRAELPILLTTGYSELIFEENIKAAGIREVLMKPVKKDDLAAAVERVLSTGGGAIS